MAIPLQNAGVLGVGITYVSFSKIEAMDSAGNLLGDIKPYNAAASVCYGWKMGDLSLGAGAKFIRQDYDTDKGTGIALDGGLMYSTDKKLTVGFSILNLGPKTKVGDVKNKLPLDVRGGVGYRMNSNFLCGLDAEKPEDGDMRIHMGAEYNLGKSLTARIGYQSLKDVGITAGAGFKSEVGNVSEDEWGQSAATTGDRNKMILSIDYAYVSYGNLDATHRISAGLKF
jgi:hypothetical protein